MADDLTQAVVFFLISKVVIEQRINSLVVMALILTHISYRSFSETMNPAGRTTNTMVVGPDDYLSSRFIYPDGSGYETDW